MYYFASDIHLGAGGREYSRMVENRFVEWLDAVGEDAEALFLLGDVFDFWFEYRRVVPKGFVRVLAKLSELTSRGVRVVFLTGNHDMWVWDYLTEECGVEVYTKPIFESIAGKRLFLAHGDNMKIDGQPMLKLMNATFRSKVARMLFSWLVHPDLALKFGRWWSGNSRKRHRVSDFDERVTEPLIAYAREHNSREPQTADHYLFGHMHFARDYREKDLHVVLLGCWEEGRGSYATLDESGALTLHKTE